jgi:hypothetical protein
VYNIIIINLAKEDIKMQGEVIKFNNGLVLEVVKDRFGTAKKDHDDMPNGFRIHVRNANTCEQFDTDYYCGSAYKSSDDIETKSIIENLFDSCIDYEYFVNVDEMANEFGYTSISQAVAIWKDMGETHEEMIRVCGDMDIIQDALNECMGI